MTAGRPPWRNALAVGLLLDSLLPFLQTSPVTALTATPFSLQWHRPHIYWILEEGG